jgi:hypothetical protein
MATQEAGPMTLDERSREGHEEEEAQIGGTSGWTLASNSVLLGRNEYRRLFLRHLLSLFPALALVVGIAFAARAIPCELSRHQDKGPDAADRCDEALHANLTLAASSVGVVAWLAGWSLRPAAWLVASYFAAFPDIGYNEIDPVATTIVSIFLRNLCVEILRLFSLAVSYGLFIAEVAVNSKVGHIDVPDLGAFSSDEQQPIFGVFKHFRLRARDPRFSIAMWVSLGWAIAETISGCVQILQQLSLYAPALEPPTKPSTPSPPTPAVIYSPPALSRALPEDGQPQPAKKRTSAQASNGKSAAPSTQLVHARDELSRSLHKDIKQYGDTEGSSKTAISSKHVAEGSTPADAIPLMQDIDADMNEGQEAEMEAEMERNFEEMIRARQREELEETLGAALPDVPVSLCLLWRIDKVLFNVGGGVSTYFRGIALTIADSSTFLS